MFGHMIRFVAALAVLMLAVPSATAMAGAGAPGGLSEKVAKLTYEDLVRLLPDNMYGHTSETWGEIAKVTIAGVDYSLPFIVQEDAVYTWHYMKKYLPHEVAAKPTSGQPNDEQILLYVVKLTEAADNNADVLIRKNFDANKAKYTLLYPDAKGDTLFTEVFDRYVTDENGKNAPEAQKAYNEFVALSMLASALRNYIVLKEKL